MHPHLVILGASARAAAASAARAGFLPAAADLFGDRDLTAMAEWVPIDDYPRGLRAAASRLPAAPWIYTGGLENHPGLVDQIAGDRPLLGNPGDVLRSVRDPFRLAVCLRDVGLDYPEVSRDPPPPGRKPRWLRKPLRSCGGRGIERWDEESPRRAGDMEPAEVYFQRLVTGAGYSAVFVAAKGAARLLGVTRQLTGEPWTGAGCFAYCGSLGPTSFGATVTATIERIGNRLAETFGLVGLLGVDMIVNGPRVFVVEVNPRFTASVELLEQAFAGNRHVMRDHVDACWAGVLPPETSDPVEGSWGKAILFAQRRTRIGESLRSFIDQTNQGKDWTPLADLPREGTEIEAGHPILTLREAAPMPRTAKHRLKRLAAAVRAALALDNPE